MHVLRSMTTVRPVRAFTETCRRHSSDRPAAPGLTRRRVHRWRRAGGAVVSDVALSGTERPAADIRLNNQTNRRFLMLGHINATNATFEQLANAGWFSAVGSPTSSNVSTVSSWAEAIEQCASHEWENLCLDAANHLRSRIGEAAPARLQQWNTIVERMKAVSMPLVRAKVAQVVSEHALPKVFEDTVQWDVLHLLMEAEYSDIVAPSFYAAQAIWYVNGRFPCGWAGAFPNGRLVIF